MKRLFYRTKSKGQEVHVLTTGRERKNLHMDFLNQTHVLTQASTAGLHTQDKKKQMICVTPCKHKSEFWMSRSGFFKMADLFQSQFMEYNLKHKVFQAFEILCSDMVRPIEVANSYEFVRPHSYKFIRYLLNRTYFTSCQFV